MSAEDEYRRETTLQFELETTLRVEIKSRPAPPRGTELLINFNGPLKRKVFLVGGDKQYPVTPDDKGVYFRDDLPAGDYELRFEAKPDPEPQPEPEPQPQPEPESPPEPAMIGKVYFATGVHALNRAAREAIGSAISRILTYGLEKIAEIKCTGFADLRGGSRYNQALSERRAMAVKLNLEKRLADLTGRQISMVSSGGRGEVARGSLRENRRVEIWVTYQRPKPRVLPPILGRGGTSPPREFIIIIASPGIGGTHQGFQFQHAGLWRKKAVERAAGFNAGHDVVTILQMEHSYYKQPIGTTFRDKKYIFKYIREAGSRGRRIAGIDYFGHGWSAGMSLQMDAENPNNEARQRATHIYVNDIPAQASTMQSSFTSDAYWHIWGCSVSGGRREQAPALHTTIGGVIANKLPLRSIAAPPGTGTVFVKGGKQGMRVQNLFNKDITFWKKKGFHLDSRGYMHYTKSS